MSKRRIVVTVDPGDGIRLQDATGDSTKKPAATVVGCAGGKKAGSILRLGGIRCVFNFK